MTSAPRRATLLAVLTLVASVVVAFWPAFGAEFQEHWDDNYNLTLNEHWRGLGAEQLGWMLTSFRLGHWMPLTWLSFAVDHAFWDMNPTGYHVTNVALHALNAVLFFFVCRAVLAAAGSAAAARVLPSLLAALFFAVHPLRVESVVWITERRDVLSSAFLLATVLAWLRWRATGEHRFYVLALALYVPALCAKAWGITLPVVLLVLDVWPLARVRAVNTGACVGALLREKLPFFALALPTAILAFLAQRDSGAMNYAEEFGLLQKGAQASYGLGFYVLKTALPTGLLPIYSLDTALDPSELRYVVSFVAVGLVAAVAFALRRRLPGLAVACLVYAIVVAPVLGLTQSGIQLVADRYSYLSTLPFAVLLAGVIGRLRVGPGVVAGVGALALGALAASTFAYARVWHDSKTLFTDASERAPHEWFPWSQLGTIAFHEGDPQGAIALYDRALAADERAWLAYESRGLARASLGDRDGAVADWTRAIELYPHSPISFVNRGGYRLQAGDLDGARADFEGAVAADPENAGAWLMLGTARLRLGAEDARAARSALERAFALAEPDSPIAAQAERLLAEARE